LRAHAIRGYRNESKAGIRKRCALARLQLHKFQTDLSFDLSLKMKNLLAQDKITWTDRE
jgi:hypothetical protein